MNEAKYKLWFNKDTINHYFNDNNFSSLIDEVNSDDSIVTSNIENIYHHTVPNVKLFYPEPFVATPTFLHYDIWFIHISIYQYWLWFFFTFIVVFFTIVFLNTLKLCNIRVRPKRETRGVSRSKCGDLITVSVPVSWAGSIIVHESTDAIEYYDGFGTAEMAVGVRAYQWGWEYYYPKDIDLNYKIKNSNNYFVGNSIKYNTGSSDYSEVYNFWNYTKSKDIYDGSVTPAHLLVTSKSYTDNFSFGDAKNFGVSKVLIRNAYRNILESRHITYNNYLNYCNYDFKSYTNHVVDSVSNSLETNNYAQPNLSNTETTYLSTNSLFSNSTNLNNLKQLNRFFINNINFHSGLIEGVESQLPTTAGYINRNCVINRELLSNDYLKQTEKLNTLLTQNYILSKNLFETFPQTDESGLGGEDTLNELYFRNLYLKTGFDNNQSTDFTIHDKSYKTKNNTHFLYTKKYLSGEKLIQPILSERTTLGFIKNLHSYKNPCVLDDFNKLESNSKLQSEKNTYTTLINNNNLIYNKVTNSLIAANLINNTPSSMFEKVDFWNLNPYFDMQGYESYGIGELGNPGLFVSEDSYIEEHIKNKFIDTHYTFSGYTNKLLSDINHVSNSANLKWPNVYLYADIDFKRIESNELMEDMYWESFYSDDNWYEYSEMFKESKKGIKEEFDGEATFGMFDMENDNMLVMGKYQRGFYYNSNLHTWNKFYNDINYNYNLLYNYQQTVRNRFGYMFGLSYLEKSSMDSLFSVKNNQLNLNYLNYNVVTNSANYKIPLTHISLLEKFWNNFNERRNVVASSENCENSKLLIPNNTANLNTFNTGIEIYENMSKNFKKINSHFIFKYNGRLDLYTSIIKNIDMRFSEFLSSEVVDNTVINETGIRTNVPNSIIASYKAVNLLDAAVLKVYRPYLDEGRSCFDFSNLSSTEKAIPALTSPLVKFKRLLSKNSNNFSKTFLYKQNRAYSIDNTHILNNNLNYFSFDFPFKAGVECDFSRYLWFDWYSNNSLKFCKSLNTSEYNLFGAKKYAGKYEFSTTEFEYVNEIENYLTKLAHARRIYSQSWTYATFSLSRTKLWYPQQSMHDAVSEAHDQFMINPTSLNRIEMWNLTTRHCKEFLRNWFFSTPRVSSSAVSKFVNGTSNIILPNRNYWRSVCSYGAYSFYTVRLADILTKREFLIRQLLKSKKQFLSIPKVLTMYPTNELYLDIKSLLVSNLQSELRSEYTRYVVPHYLKSLNFSILYRLNSSTIVKLLNKYIFSRLVEVGDYSKKESVLYRKSQYKHMRKNISNMVKIQSDSAVAMPTNTRIQLVTVSKDIIHSWAIPSAGIKIDCIPGYSSHKVTIFFLSGIYWGQCMEICGRFHHWMPIVVYFLKRDLFILWCVHFMHKNRQSSDKISQDFSNVVSFSSKAWTSELN